MHSFGSIDTALIKTFWQRIVKYSIKIVLVLKGNSRVGQHFSEKPCKCCSHCNPIKKYIFSELCGSEIEIQSVKFAAYSNFRH